MGTLFRRVTQKQHPLPFILSVVPYLGILYRLMQKARLETHMQKEQNTKDFRITRRMHYVPNMDRLN